MADGLNRVQLFGHLGRDPEIRTLNNGNKVANLSVATSKSWFDKQSNQRREKTEWHRVTVWGDGLISKVIEPYVVKGSQVYVEGELETRKWQDQQGNDRYTTEVVVNFGGKLLLAGGKTGQGGGARSGGDLDDAFGRGGGGYDGGGYDDGPGDLDDEIPF